MAFPPGRIRALTRSSVAVNGIQSVLRVCHQHRCRYVFELESGLLTSLEEILPPARPDTPNFDPKDGHWKTAEGAEPGQN